MKNTFTKYCIESIDYILLYRTVYAQYSNTDILV